MANEAKATRKVVLEYPEEIAVQIDDIVKDVEDPKYYDENLKATVHPKKFPNGFADWVEHIVRTNIQQAIGHSDPVITQIQQEMANLHQRSADRFKAVSVK